MALSRKPIEIVNQGNHQLLTKAKVAFCSLEEQNSIVGLMEEKFSEVEQLELTITTSLQQAEALRQSILKKAFSGQLVPQDPQDEPTSALLERIKAEKTMQVKPTKSVNKQRG